MTEANQTADAAPGQEQTSPASDPSGSAAETQQQQPQYVTPEMLEKFGEQLAGRLKQSNRDHKKQVEAEIEAIRTKLDKAGVQLQPEQEAKLRNEISDQIEEGLFSQDDRGDDAPDADEFISGFLGQVFQQSGTPVTAQDPEWAELQKVIDDTWNDPNGGVKVAAAAVKASMSKAARVSKNQESASARVVGGGGPQSSGNANKPAIDMFKEAFRNSK